MFIKNLSSHPDIVISRSSGQYYRHAFAPNVISLIGSSIIYNYVMILCLLPTSFVIGSLISGLGSQGRFESFFSFLIIGSIIGFNLKDCYPCLLGHTYRSKSTPYSDVYRPFSPYFANKYQSQMIIFKPRFQLSLNPIFFFPLFNFGRCEY